MRVWSASAARLALVAALVAGCAPDPAPSGETPAGRVAVSVAALSLPGVGDVVWDVEVQNGADPATTVWQRRLSSSGYGDGAGSASYVGPCDAAPDASMNTVRVWVVGVFSAPVDALGTFASGADGGVDGDAVAFENPTGAAPLEREVRCLANADAPVTFDVALMRPAQQGFFDIAVSFDDLFCSAKFDCCVEDATGATCTDLDLLFDASGARAATVVLGFACTAGSDTGVETQLYLDPLRLDCTSPTTFDAPGFAADVTLDPTGAAGNQCTTGTQGMSDCTGVVTEAPGIDADAFLFQVAVYRGVERLTSDGVDAHKVYWNVALGVKRPAIDGCWLTTQGTAADAHGDAISADGLVAPGSVYPYIAWRVKLGTCGAEPLTFDDPDAMVRPAYTGTTDPQLGFAYGFGPSFPAAPFVHEAVFAPASGQATTLAFPATVAGSTATAPIAFTNVGGVTGALPAPSFGGPDAARFSVSATTCGSVAPGASCALTVQFAPVAAGAATATLDAASTTFTLSGTGSPACSDTTPRVYAYTGALATGTVPAGCTTLRAELWGAGGGGAQNAGYGGGGGYTLVSGVAVTPLATYAVVVGQGGASPCNGNCSGSTISTGAFGGGATAYEGNGGGGYSGIFSGGSATRTAALAIAGGGGGGGGGTSLTHGGAGGGPSGLAGATGTTNANHTGGGGGTSVAGGAAAYSDQGTPHAGAALVGGSTVGCYGGSGGGGYFGGGSGGRDGSWNHRGGGGGSGFVLGGAGTLTAGSGRTPGNTTSSNYAAGVGVGSAVLSTRGGNGRVVLWFE